MRRLRRILLNAATVVSLVLFLSTLALWAHSRFQNLQVVRSRYSPSSVQPMLRKWWISSANGWLALNFGTTGTRFAEGVDVLKWFPEAGGGPPMWEWRTDPLPDPEATMSGGSPVRWGRATFQNYGAFYDLRCLSIRYWLVAVLFGLWPAAALLVRTFRRRRVQFNHCPVCGYDLRATPDRCPECGHQPSS